jgi:hypothetical protein
MAKSQSSKGLPKRTGNRKSKISHYYSTRYLQNKLRRILARNGKAAAEAWAATHLATGVLNKIVKD